MFALGEPANTPYDLRFNLFGCQVRVSALFWLVAALLGYNQARGIDFVFDMNGRDTPGSFSLLLIWLFAMFVSILVHELGHHYAFRFFGIDSHIVLYHFGGLAIPSGGRRSTSSSPYARKLSAYRQIIISAAGPAAQIVLAIVVAVVARSMGYNIGSLGSMLKGFGAPDIGGVTPNSAAVYALIDFLIFPSVYWALFNLLPVIPLDGGRIAEEIICMFFRGTQRDAIVLSMVCSILVTIWAFSRGETFMGLFFLSFAFANFETLQSGGMRRPW
jgi:stage IV sporulation protein FB